MNCANHLEAPAAAFCRTCGKPLCVDCKRDSLGTVFCEEHVPAGANVYTPPPPPPRAATPMDASANPRVAAFLGLIPGVGAIYNGQYVKGLVHALVFGLLITMMDHMEHSAGGPMIALVMVAFYIYMVIEAYHTAKRRQLGMPVDEFSSIIPMQPNKAGGGAPSGAIALIVVGVVFLLDTIDLISFRQLLRYWPVMLIAMGIYQLMQYRRGDGTPEPPPLSTGMEPGNEQR